MKKFTDNDLNHMHDRIFDLTNQSYTRDELINIYEKLPLNLKHEATEWGMSDTLWRDKFSEWYIVNYLN